MKTRVPLPAHWMVRKVEALEGEPISAWQSKTTEQVLNLLRSGNIIEFENDETMSAFERGMK